MSYAQHHALEKHQLSGSVEEDITGSHGGGHHWGCLKTLLFL